MLFFTAFTELFCFSFVFLYLQCYKGDNSNLILQPDACKSKTYLVIPAKFRQSETNIPLDSNI
jgi:hypothetical protein